MLNDKLYLGLKALFKQEPEVAAEGEQGVFSCPPVKRYRTKRKDTRFARVEAWGECYRFNCPGCGDTRGRLFFSYLYEQVTQVSKVTYRFGRVYHCHNEGCNLHDILDRLVLPVTNQVVEQKPATFTGFMQNDTELPAGCISLMSQDVPSAALEYLYARGFDPTELTNKFMVLYAREGTVYKPKTETEPAKEFFEGRLVIPVVQGRRLVGWQARRLEDVKKDKYKYLNEDGFRKSQALYNMDRAAFHRDMVVVEGVTDCWKTGDHSVALFGKKASAHQLSILSMMWRYSGSCVIMLDGDAWKQSNWLARKLREAQAFPRGIAEVHLDGRDPGDMSKAEIQSIVEEAWTRCSL